MITQYKTKFQDLSKKRVSFQTGCEYDCLYCYAKGYARGNGEWHKPKIRMKDVNRRYSNYGEVLMFPSSHDITLNNRRYAYGVLSKLLGAGNQVLIVTKPTLKIIQEICGSVGHYRDQILFIFTITSLYDSDLKKWEPGAPNFQERFDSLKHAYEQGFNTSVSIEPMLSDNTVALSHRVLPYITDKIWIGKMHHQQGPVRYDQIRNIKNQLRNEPKVKFKTGT